MPDDVNRVYEIGNQFCNTADSLIFDLHSCNLFIEVGEIQNFVTSCIRNQYFEIFFDIFEYLFATPTPD